MVVLKERNFEVILFSFLLFFFILTFVYKPEKLRFLEQPLLLKIGAASYCMYLIHYHLGVVLVRSLNESLGYLSPLIVIIIVITFGLFCYEFFEKKLIKFYKRILK